VADRSSNPGLDRPVGQPAQRVYHVAEVAEMARLQGAVVATARCFGAAGRLALAPVADWLRNDAVQSAAATLDPVWRAEVARLLPTGGRGTGSGATTDAWQRHRFFEGLARALIAVRRPLLLVVMRWYRELLPSLPEELNGWIALLTIPPAPPFPEPLWGRKACGIVWCYTGPHDRADEVLEPVRSFGSPLVVGLHSMPFTALQSAFDPLYSAGLQWYWRADFFHEISDAAIDVHVTYGAQLPTGHSTMHLYPIDGAASRVPADATAFPYRDGGYNGIITGCDPDPANAGLISRWAKDYWEELHPTSAGGAYVNFLMDEGQDRVKASYRGNYDRLAQIKRRYDPDNTFHTNQNIQPARPPGA
jgi:Berberine and berberine like